MKPGLFRHLGGQIAVTDHALHRRNIRNTNQLQMHGAAGTSNR